MHVRVDIVARSSSSSSHSSSGSLSAKNGLQAAGKTCRVSGGTSAEVPPSNLLASFSITYTNSAQTMTHYACPSSCTNAFTELSTWEEEVSSDST